MTCFDANIVAGGLHSPSMVDVRHRHQTLAAGAGGWRSDEHRLVAVICRAAQEWPRHLLPAVLRVLVLPIVGGSLVPLAVVKLGNLVELPGAGQGLLSTPAMNIVCAIAAAHR